MRAEDKLSENRKTVIPTTLYKKIFNGITLSRTTPNRITSNRITLNRTTLNIITSNTSHDEYIFFNMLQTLKLW